MKCLKFHLLCTCRPWVWPSPFTRPYTEHTVHDVLINSHLNKFYVYNHASIRFNHIFFISVNGEINDKTHYGISKQKLSRQSLTVPINRGKYTQRVPLSNSNSIILPKTC